MKVYVSSYALDNAINEANSVNSLARGLLEVVFTLKALKICTATKRLGAMESRTMLNPLGIKAIYAFVKNHTLRKTNWCREGWNQLVQQRMKRSVTQKLNEFKWNADRKK